MIYLDNAATTPVMNPAVTQVNIGFYEKFGNPGSIHSVGRDTELVVSDSRKEIAKTINAKPEQIVFTSGATEANNMVLLGLKEYLLSKGKNHIIVSSVEHPSVMNPARKLEANGFKVTYLPVNQYGQISMADLFDAITEETGLVSIMCVNNEIGTPYDPEVIGAICKKKKVLFHTDCVQAYGTVPLDVKKSHIDFLTASGHKIHGPKGIGFLYAKNKELLTPLVYGGGQESGLRSGTENVPGIMGLTFVAEYVTRNCKAAQEANRVNKKILLKTLDSHLGETYHVNGCPEDTQRILNLRFDGVDGESLVLLLSKRGVMVSAGSACSSHSARPSHVLKAIGLTDDEARSSIRISMSSLTTSEEMRSAAEEIAECVKALRGK